MNRVIFMLVISFLFSARGDLISFEYKGSKESSVIQYELDESVGQLSPNAIFNIKLN